MRRTIVALAAIFAAAPAATADNSYLAALNPTSSPTLAAAQSGLDASSDVTVNPFGLPTLKALSATRDRPLFSASRRPPPIIAAAPAIAPALPAPAPEAPPEATHAPFTLVGTLLGPGQGLAWLQDGSQATHKVREGDAEAGWVLRSVGPRSVVLEKMGVAETIGLPKAGQSSAAGAGADGDLPPFEGSLPSSFQANSPEPAPVASLKPHVRGDAK